MDTCGLSVPITKHNFWVDSAEALLEVIPRAFSLALSGSPPRPGAGGHPKDVQLQRIAVSHWPGQVAPQAAPAPDADKIAQAAQMINQAKRPILYLGGGVVHSGASEAAVDPGRANPSLPPP